MRGSRWRRMAFVLVVAGAYGLVLAPVLAVVVISVFAQEIVSFPPEGFTLRWYANAWEKREFARGWKLVATDLDGTLLRADGTVSARTAEVLEGLDRLGVPFVMVTGRPLRWIDDLLPLVEDPTDPLGVMDLTTHRVALEDAPDAYRMFQEKTDGCIKVVLQP